MTRIESIKYIQSVIAYRGNINNRDISDQAEQQPCVGFVGSYWWYIEEVFSSGVVLYPYTYDKYSDRVAGVQPQICGWDVVGDHEVAVIAEVARIISAEKKPMKLSIADMAAAIIEQDEDNKLTISSDQNGSEPMVIGYEYVELLGKTKLIVGAVDGVATIVINTNSGQSAYDLKRELMCHFGDVDLWMIKSSKYVG